MFFSEHIGIVEVEVLIDDELFVYICRISLFLLVE